MTNNLGKSHCNSKVTAKAILHSAGGVVLGCAGGKLCVDDFLKKLGAKRNGRAFHLERGAR